MHILVIDGGHVEAEFRAKFGPGHEYVFFHFDAMTQWAVRSVPQSVQEIRTKSEDRAEAFRQHVAWAEIAFDFTGYEEAIADELRLPVFLNCSDSDLLGHELFSDKRNGRVVSRRPNTFGFCGLPTLLNRPLLEVSLYREADRPKLADTCATLGTDYRIVADRVGLVTPRVVCQIINEAYYTVQEGTASKADVDLAMKLGTNYPHGPFAWAEAIGLNRVYAVLEALWHDTHDERYKVCPLLKKEALTADSNGFDG